MKLLRRFLAAVVLISPLALSPINASADSTLIRMVPCVRAGHNVTVAAGAPITLTVGWAMATRGNLQDFVNAAKATFTLNGTAVTPTTSDPIPLPGTDSGSEGWRVDWTLNTTAPAKSQSVVWTTTVTLSRDVTDHELGLGKPVTIPAGVLFTAPPFFCAITGS